MPNVKRVSFEQTEQVLPSTPMVVDPEIPQILKDLTDTTRRDGLPAINATYAEDTLTDQSDLIVPSASQQHDKFKLKDATGDEPSYARDTTSSQNKVANHSTPKQTGRTSLGGLQRPSSHVTSKRHDRLSGDQSSFRRSVGLSLVVMPSSAWTGVPSPLYHRLRATVVEAYRQFLFSGIQSLYHCLVFLSQLSFNQSGFSS